AEGDDDSFGGFFFRGIRDNDSTFFRFLLFGRFYQNSVTQRFEVNGHRFCVFYFMLLIVYESNPAALAAGKQLPEAAHVLPPLPAKMVYDFFSSTTSASMIGFSSLPPRPPEGPAPGSAG